MKSLESFINKHWYNEKVSFLMKLFYPFSLVFIFISNIRKKLHKKKQVNYKTPIIIVGNITVGGVGKTPLIISIVNYLQNQNKKVAVISRGYKGKVKSYPLLINDKTKVEDCGDEPFMLYQIIKAPILIDFNRNRAVSYIEENLKDIDVIISDDGLQHYKLKRDIEILVIDSKRKFGNNLCIPAGPLRENQDRINSVDFVVTNGGIINTNFYEMKLVPKHFVNLKYFDIHYKELEDKKVHVVAGIGNPKRFFDTIKDLGYQTIEHPFPDHYQYKEEDFDFNDNLPIIMTHKDAVKCLNFSNKSKLFYLSTETEVEISFLEKLLFKLNSLKSK